MSEIGGMQTQPMGPLRVDVISDVVCPWCYVGKKRLEAALALVPQVHAEIFWRPYQLDPTIPEGGISREDYLNRKFTPEQVREMNSRLMETGSEAGIAFAFERIKISPNTLDAHRLIRWAQAVGTQSAVKERLFQMYFLEGRDIGASETLAEAGAENGIDGDVTRRLLEGDTDLDAVQEEIETAGRMGIQGVPFFIFNSKLAVSGAQPVETLVQAIQQAMTRAEDE